MRSKKNNNFNKYQEVNSTCIYYKAVCTCQAFYYISQTCMFTYMS